MKKVFALVLALGLVLAALPVFAETDFTGLWHIVMTDMTIGTVELNADGTCAVSTTAGVEEKKNSGSWAADGNAVTLTFGEEKLSLTFDGTDLVLSEAAADQDAASILKFSRNAGTATVDELNAYIASGTVPEGKTKEEMEAVEAQLGLLFLFALSAPSETPDYSGTWYMTMTELTCGSFELNADGTFVGHSATAGAETKANGTWTAEGNMVILTFADQPLRLHYDGKALVPNTMARYDSADDAMIGTFMKLTREPGTATPDDLKAYAANGTIPEGRTKEEMEAVQNQMVVLLLIAAFAE